VVVVVARIAAVPPGGVAGMAVVSGAPAGRLGKILWAQLAAVAVGEIGRI